MTKNFLSKITRTKVENYFFTAKTKQKNHYLVRFWRVFVPRETGGQNQIVPRETYDNLCVLACLHFDIVSFIACLSVFVFHQICA